MPAVHWQVSYKFLHSPEVGQDNCVCLERMAPSTLDLLAGYLTVWMEDQEVEELVATALG
jgi:hypothetical protein